MSIQKPSLPKGTRDFGPIQMARRNYIFKIIKETFQLYGYQQLETPAMENLAVLTGKYGDEGDQLLYKILNSGDFLKKVKDPDLREGSTAVMPKVAEKGLRYDLTVPFARYVVMNRHEINFPFKRFQIQPVWRADRPQKGRYREFYQCDADVVGTDSLICETEILLMIRKVFFRLKLTDYNIKINNRKILTGISEVIGEKGKESALCVAIDKLDKIGWGKVQEELLQRGFSRDAINKLEPVINLSGGNLEKISFMKQFLSSSDQGMKGIMEIEEIFQLLEEFGEEEDHIQFDVVLARGLSYYTGAIFEVKVNKVSIGSVSGGGRYDNLTGVFGMEGVSGVGFSFGVDRIYDVLQELNLFPDDHNQSSCAMIGYFDEEGRNYGLKILNGLRSVNIPAEIFPDYAKVKKQFNYADRKGIPFVILVGSDEIKQHKITLKNLKTGEQKLMTFEDAIGTIKAS
ncbi:histidine--tRNA ligase [Echinicola jeungdonensis]|uniref:Histidine--tRNA ligase n=1 Tax=Echinicola jeungdonensis TaxID=709343 RepID=A0ABV5J6G8_9BACT|nr:histidine--tRNA ligase [Echinicola jeungdonensis]MDN3668054.1 histidine--tRNA ligase [Echinicola jeungdonensis]